MTTTGFNRERRERRKRERERFEATMEAARDERERFNAAIQAGAEPILQTAFGPYRVTAVNRDWWYSTSAQRSFCGCNDGDWADLLHQAGVVRNPLFVEVRS